MIRNLFLQFIYIPVKALKDNFEMYICFISNSRFNNKSYVLVFLNSNSVSVQDPFSDGIDPAFHKRNMLNSGGPYQTPMNPMDSMMRMQYDNKDHFAGMRKG